MGFHLVEGSTKRCFRCICMEEGHFKIDCLKSEDTTLRCFRCNSEGHVKVQCPLLKSHFSKDKDKVQGTNVWQSCYFAKVLRRPDVSLQSRKWIVRTLRKSLWDC